MKYIISVFFLGLTGCNSLVSDPNLSLSKLSNDELCQSLGTYNDNGSLILKIHNEIKKRGKVINNERCFALEVTEKEKNKLPLYKIGTGMGENCYPSDLTKQNRGLLNSLNKNAPFFHDKNNVTSSDTNSPGINFRYSSDGIKNK